MEEGESQMVSAVHRTYGRRMHVSQSNRSWNSQRRNAMHLDNV